MATQTVEFIASTGQTITAKLFSVGSDTVVASVVAVEGTNRKGTYSVDFTDIPAGLYRISAFNPSVIPLAHYWVDLVLATAVYQAYEVPLSVVASQVAALITPLLPSALDGGRILAVLATGERDDIADRTEAAILNEGDATALMQALADKIELALVDEGDSTATILAITTAVNAAIAAGAVGTSVAAIQERTDNLPDVPAAVGSAMTLTGAYVAATTAATQASVDAVAAAVAALGVSIPAGPGGDTVTITISDDGTPEEDVSVWISTDSGGSAVVAGTLVTDALGQATFLLTAGASYYLWAQKAGKISIQGQLFVAVAD